MTSSCLLRLDTGDLDLGVALAVPLAPPIPGLVLVPEDRDLRALVVADDLRVHRHTGQCLRVGRDGLAVDHEHRRERDRGTDFAIKAIDVDDISDGDLLLVTAAADDRVHRGLTLSLGLFGRARLARVSRHAGWGAVRADALGYGLSHRLVKLAAFTLVLGFRATGFRATGRALSAATAPGRRLGRFGLLLELTGLLLGLLGLLFRLLGLLIGFGLHGGAVVTRRGHPVRRRRLARAGRRFELGHHDLRALLLRRLLGLALAATLVRAVGLARAVAVAVAMAVAGLRRAGLDRVVVHQNAAALAVRTRLAERLEQTGTDAFTGHLDQAQRRHLGHLMFRPVAAEALDQATQHQVAVRFEHHVDEVDDDDAADVAQPQLPDDLFGRLEVVLGDRLFEVAPGPGEL